jgi:hypothetical protein
VRGNSPWPGHHPNSECDMGGRANGVSTRPISAYNSITSTFSETSGSEAIATVVPERSGTRVTTGTWVDNTGAAVGYRPGRYQRQGGGGVVSQPGGGRAGPLRRGTWRAGHGPDDITTRITRSGYPTAPRSCTLGGWPSVTRNGQTVKAQAPLIAMVVLPTTWAIG